MIPSWWSAVAVCRLGCPGRARVRGRHLVPSAGGTMRATLIAAIGFWRVLAELIIETLWREHTPVPPTSPWTDGTDMDRG